MTVLPVVTHPALQLISVSKTYGDGPGSVRALDKINLALDPATFTAVMGPSGSGKSTLLHCAAGLTIPTKGQVIVEGRLLPVLNDAALTRFRREHIGVVFQEANLLDHLTVLQNAELPLRLAGRNRSATKSTVYDLAGRVGLGGRLHHYPSQLSGGEKQRTAIIRAVAAEPPILLADEPTGALDQRSAAEILDLLRDLVDHSGQTLMMVTHDPISAARADSVVFLADGRFIDRLDRPSPELVAQTITHLAGDATSRRARLSTGGSYE